MNRIKVLVVDDSAVVRKLLTEELSRFPDIEVVGGAADPYQARERIVELNPDVLTLDIEMPKMDGLTFLEKVMASRPMPVIIVSSMAPERSENAFRALELGAVEIVPKPGSQFSIPDVGRLLVHAVRAAAKARLRRNVAARPVARPPSPAPALKTTTKILAVGASTGGTQALEVVLAAMPANGPATVVVQHMPEGFTLAFAKRLDSICAMEVKEAEDGDAVIAGRILIAPGNRHMLLARSGAHYHARLKDGPLVHYQRPAVDVLFQSVAKVAAANAFGVILTGMGADGAAGLLAMKQAGAGTLAQDEETSVVWGMPGAAVKMGAADEVAPLEGIAGRILERMG